MFKHFLSRWGILLLMSLAFLFVGAICCGLFVYVFGSVGSMVFYSIFSVIATFLFYSVIHNDNDEEAADCWKAYREKNKKIKFVHVFLCLLPMLLTFVVLLVVHFLANPYIVSKFAQGTALEATDVSASNNAKQAATLLRAVIFIPMVSQLSGWVYHMVLYAKLRCPKCGAVCSHTYESLDSFRRFEETQTKTKDTYGKIGDVYVKDKKIGALEGKTGTQTYTKTISGSVSHETWRCLFCGRPKTKRKYSVTNLGSWKH